MPIFAKFLPNCCKNFKYNPCNLRGYWTKLHLCFTRCSKIIPLLSLHSPDDIVIRCVMPEQRVTAINYDICKLPLQF